VTKAGHFTLSFTLTLLAFSFFPLPIGEGQEKKASLIFHFKAKVKKGDRIKLSYKESLQSLLTVDKRPRKERKDSLSFEAMVHVLGDKEAPFKECEVELSKISGQKQGESWKELSATLTVKADKIKWSKLKPVPLHWLGKVFAGGKAPKAMGDFFCPKNELSAGDSWAIEEAQWRGRMGLKKSELKNFKGRGQILSVSNRGLARFSIEVKYQPARFGALVLNDGARFKLTITGTLDVSNALRPFEVTTNSELSGDFEVDHLPGKKAPAKLVYRQTRVLKRSLAK
jgi:hypothetical protein